MEKSKEYEAKRLISHEQFNQILKDSNVEDVITQENFYFDHDDYLKNHHQALRIRMAPNLCQLTLKEKTPQGNIEKTIDITPFMADEIISEKALPLKLADQLNIGISYFNSCATIKTTRYLIPFNNHIVELDANTFDETNHDYEIEIESSSLDLAEKTMDDFLTKHQIEGSQSKPKIARFYEYKQ